MISNIVKKSLGQEEEIKEYFSICSRHIKIQIIGLLIKWSAIFLAISAGLFFVDQAQLIAIPESKKIFNQEEKTFINDFSRYGLDQKEFSFLNIDIDTSEVSQWILSSWLILAVIFVMLVVPLIIFYNIFYLKISNEFLFTNQRIIVKRGWIETSIKTIYYSQITDISVNQSFLERIIGSGTISISTAGSDGYEVVLYHIKNPYKMKKILYDIKLEYQKKNSIAENENRYEDQRS